MYRCSVRADLPGNAFIISPIHWPCAFSSRKFTRPTPARSRQKSPSSAFAMSSRICRTIPASSIITSGVTTSTDGFFTSACAAATVSFFLIFT